MKTFAESACLVLLAAWAGGTIAPAQTNLPPAAVTNRTPIAPPPAAKPHVSSSAAITNPPTPVTRVPSRRYSGKILTVDTKTQIITLQGGEKAGIGITTNTTIFKDKKRAAFDALAVGQSVSGMERRDAAGKWQAETLNVGDTRLVLDEPEVIVAPDSKDTDKQTANIHILVPGGASEVDFAFGNMPAQPGIVRTNILSNPITSAQLGADFQPGADLARSIHVDGGAVVAWYPNIADQDIICHVTPGKHAVTVILKDMKTGDFYTIGPITVSPQAGETQIADFR
jgi:hypothetical protein